MLRNSKHNLHGSDHPFSVHVFLPDRVSLPSRWRDKRIYLLSAQELLVHRDEMFHIGTVGSNIETPRLLETDMLLLGYPLVLQEMLGP